MMPKKKKRTEFSKPICQPKRTVVDGITFASKHEAKVYGELKLLERAGKICAIDPQVPYPLKVNGMYVCTYIADFVYIDLEKKDITKDRRVVLDAKQFRTPIYRIKKALMLAIYGIEIIER